MSPLANTPVTLTTSLGTFTNTLSTMIIMTNSKGTATIDLHPGKIAGTATVTATIGTKDFVGYGTLEVGFAGIPTQWHTEVMTQRLPLAGSTTVTTTLHDAYTYPVPQQPVTFSTDHGTVAPANATTDNDGHASTTFHCPASNSRTTATVVMHTAGITDSVQVECGAVEHIILTANPQPIEARIGNTSTINATVQDANKDSVAGQDIVFTTSAGMLSVAQSTTNADGTATTTLHNPALLTGDITVLAQADGVTQTIDVEVLPIALDSAVVGDNPAVAGRLPSLNVAYAIPDTGQHNEYDYLRMELDATYTVTIALRTIPNGADYDLALLQANRLVQVGESRNGRNADEHLALRLPPGAYYVRVHKQVPAPGTEGGYTLAVISERVSE